MHTKIYICICAYLAPEQLDGFYFSFHIKSSSLICLYEGNMNTAALKVPDIQMLH